MQLLAHPHRDLDIPLEQLDACVDNREAELRRSD